MKLWSFGGVLLVGTVSAVQALVACGNAEPGGAAGAAGSGGSSAGMPAGGEPATAGSSAGSSQAGSGGGGSSSVGGEPATSAGAGGEPATSDGSLLPWNVGNSWTYRVTKNGTTTEKTTTVGDLEVVGGSGPSAKLEANHVSTSKGAGSNDHTESWQAASAANPLRILRFRELTYNPQNGMLEAEVYCDPPKLHIDGSAERTVKGATWLEEYDESTLTVGLPVSTHAVSERWTVLEDDETLKVPAGTFQHVVHLRKVGAMATKDYWYVRGIGKLKETGTQTEELVDYTLVP